MFILTSLTLPLAALTTFSSTGVSCLHGPHHGAQKSISTGWRFDSSITSFTKDWVVVSLMRPSAAVAVAVPPFCSMVSIPRPRRVVQTSRVAQLNGGYGGRMQSPKGAQEGALGGGIRGPDGDLRRSAGRRNRLDPGCMAGGGEEPDEVVPADRGRHGVGERMEV